MLRAGGRLLGDTRRLHSLAWLQTVSGFAHWIIPIMQWSFMAGQPSKDGRLGGSPQNSYAGRHPEKRFVQGKHRIPSVSNLILPKVGELMVNNQQYDSHEGRPPIVAGVFHS